MGSPVDERAGPASFSGFWEVARTAVLLSTTQAHLEKFPYNSAVEPSRHRTRAGAHAERAASQAELTAWLVVDAA
jgi:hypothetical protein